jgi:hypothetical protein
MFVSKLQGLYKRMVIAMKIRKSDYFAVSLDQKEGVVLLTQKILHPIINTQELPETHDFLFKHLPTIFDNQCFNGKKLSFAEEVKSTEVGHLFEHIVLELLKIEVEKVYPNVSFKGETCWDWSKHGYGTFLITIRSNTVFKKFLKRAINKAVLILDNLYLTKISSPKGGAEAPPVMIRD